MAPRIGWLLIVTLLAAGSLSSSARGQDNRVESGLPLPRVGAAAKTDGELALAPITTRTVAPIHSTSKAGLAGKLNNLDPQNYGYPYSGGGGGGGGGGSRGSGGDMGLDLHF